MRSLDAVRPAVRRPRTPDPVVRDADPVGDAYPGNVERLPHHLGVADRRRHVADADHASPTPTRTPTPTPTPTDTGSPTATPTGTGDTGDGDAGDTGANTGTGTSTPSS